MGLPRVPSSRRVSHILLLRASRVYPPLFSLYYSSNEKSSPSAESHSPALFYHLGAWEPGQVRTLSRPRQIEHSAACMHLRSSAFRAFSGSRLYGTTQMQE